MPRIAFHCAIGLLGLWLTGLAAFAGTMVWLSGRSDAATDCAVLFTGRHGRALDGLRTLLETPPRRLLISGYGMGMGNHELAELQTLAPDFFACCADIEDQARNTSDNARETAAWARVRACTAMTLITDDVHMPRAWLELSRRLEQMPIRFIAVPYATQDWAMITVRFVFLEYHKTLATILLGLLR